MYRKKMKEKSSKHKDGVSAKNRSNGDGSSANGQPSGELPRVFRVGLIAVVISLVWWYNTSSNLQCLAHQSDHVSRNRFNVTCSLDYEDDLKQFKDCAPRQCGRVVTDRVVTNSEAKHLLKLAKAGLSLGGSNGGASILDLHTGALSKGDSFVNIYKLLKSKDLDGVFTDDDFTLYSTVARKIRHTIAAEFSVPVSKLYLTSPTFFSRMTSKAAATVHDEYWHPHVDKETYESFDYTSLLYLADYGVDFEGGRFVFTDKDSNMTVEPKLGRLSFFTSGSENTHYVERITKGTRYAITVSFTCDQTKAIDHPKIP